MRAREFATDLVNATRAALMSEEAGDRPAASSAALPTSPAVPPQAAVPTAPSMPPPIWSILAKASVLLVPGLLVLGLSLGWLWILALAGLPH